MGEHVLDVGLLEKPQPATDRVGDVARQELALQEDAVVMVAIEHGHLAERQAFFAGFEDLLANERGLLVGIRGGDDQGEAAIGAGGDEVLAESRRVAGDRGPGEGDDLGRRTVVDVELKDPCAGMALGELEDIVVVGPSEPVDRLGVVADGREVARARRRDGLDHRDLNGVGVLHLVDQDVAKHPSLCGSLVGKLADQAAPLEEQVVVVERVGRELALGVGRGGRLDVRLPLDQIGCALGDDLGEGTIHVGAVTDHVVNGRRLGGQLARAGEPGVVHGQADQVELVLAVEDGEIGLIAQQAGRAAEQAIADMVKRAGPDPSRLLADQQFHPPNHLAGGASGKRDQHDRFGRHARGDQIGDAIGDDPRLARPRPGQDQVIAVGRRHRRPLRVVQLALELIGQTSVQRRFEANLPHATARARGCSV